jgi:hypothetical protein
VTAEAKDAPAAAPAHDQDPVSAMRLRGKSPELAALLAWLIPGSGHIYAGFARKGALCLVLVLGLSVSGLYMSHAEVVSLDAETGHPYAFVAQVGCGLPTALALAYNKGLLWERPDEPNKYADPEYQKRLPEIDTGLLLTMVAGLLNLLLIHDALNGMPGALVRRADEARLRRRLDALRAERAAAAAKKDAEPAQPAAPPEVKA